MTVRDLIDELKKLDGNKEMYCFWDGSTRTKMKVPFFELDVYNWDTDKNERGYCFSNSSGSMYLEEGSSCNEDNVIMVVPPLKKDQEQEYPDWDKEEFKIMREETTVENKVGE